MKSDWFVVKIEPLTGYVKHYESEYTLCRIGFGIVRDGDRFQFSCECSDRILERILSAADDYLSGTTEEKRLSFPIPYIWGDDCLYPYSFRMKDDGSGWTFCYKDRKSGNDLFFPMTVDDVASLGDQIRLQQRSMDWDSIGKVLQYRFDLPGIEYECCYSAGALQKTLNRLCVGKMIRKMYVSTLNYAEPLGAEQNYVNYYLGPQLLILFDGLLLDLLIHGEGLFEYRYFEEREIRGISEKFDFRDEDENQFCDIGEYFDADGFSSEVGLVQVDETHYFSCYPAEFDETRLAESLELPEFVHFMMKDRKVLTLQGLEDDFVVELSM